MIDDLKQIKKFYGEAMMHFCRDNFSTILEENGLLLKLLKDNFAPTRMLYSDLISQEKIEDFKNYIYDLFYKKDEVKKIEIQTPKELMKRAGYKLYECKTEDDIQSFKKYFASGEELCTFQGNRLDRCYVFFAVKENAYEIKREDFTNPERQDKYGTSVISIQFSKDITHTLSIKNRYNHTVLNPDATFGNNLDNIIEGLTDSFEKYYGLKQEYKNECFELLGYVRANDGRWYRYNYEINNIYYCVDNVIVDYGEVIKYPKEEYLIIDYFILDLVKKQIYLHDDTIEDSFPMALCAIVKIEIKKEKENKEIIITHYDEKITKIKLDGQNRIIELYSSFLVSIEKYFLCRISSLKSLSLPNVVHIKNCFLYANNTLIDLSLPNVLTIDSGFLVDNNCLITLSLPKVRNIGDHFMEYNNILKSISFPEVREIGDSFLVNSEKLIQVDLPNLQTIGAHFLEDSYGLKKLNLPNLQCVGKCFLTNNVGLESLYVPRLSSVGEFFLFANTNLEKWDLSTLGCANDTFFINYPNQEEIVSSENWILHRVRK